MAAANGHGTPTDTDRRDTHDYAVGLRFVWHSNYPKYIVELSSNQLDHENRYPRSLASANEMQHLRGAESSHSEHQAGVALPTLKCSRVLESTVAWIRKWTALVVIIKVIV